MDAATGGGRGDTFRRMPAKSFVVSTGPMFLFLITYQMQVPAKPWIARRKGPFLLYWRAQVLVEQYQEDKMHMLRLTEYHLWQDSCHPLRHTGIALRPWI